jgi:type IV secretion system protein VirD4
MWLFLALAAIVEIGPTWLLFIGGAVMSAALSLAWLLTTIQYFGEPGTDTSLFLLVTTLPIETSTQQFAFKLFAYSGWLFGLIFWRMNDSLQMQGPNDDTTEKPGPSGVHGTVQIPTPAMIAVGLTAAEMGATPNKGEATTEEIRAGELLTTDQNNGIRLGFRDDEILRYAGDAHGLIVAPTRSGKGRDFVQPIALSCPHSMFIIDPKGEIPCITKAYRETLGPVFILNPFNRDFPERLGPSHHYNPLRMLNPEIELDADSDALAEIIVERSNSKDSHWDDKARSLISGLMMFLVETQAEKRKAKPDYEATLGELRSTITDQARLVTFCQIAISQTKTDAVKERLANLANAAKANNKSELDSITSTAERHTNFVDDAIKANSARSDFRFRDLTEKITTVYVVLPDRHAGTHASWFRLIAGAAMMELTRGERGGQVVMILDEFASMKRFDMAVNVMNQGAGRGLQCIPILQGMGQLHDIYGSAGDNFIGNAHFKVVLATDDPHTVSYVSKQAGTRWVPRESHSVGTNSGGSLDFRNLIANAFNPSKSRNTSVQLVEEPVIKPFEVAHIPKDEFVLFVKGVDHMIRGKRAAYFDETHYPEFAETGNAQKRYQPNPLAPPATRR